MRKLTICILIAAAVGFTIHAATKTPRLAAQQQNKQMAKGPVMPPPPPVPLAFKATVGQQTNPQGFYTNMPIQFDATNGITYSFFWTTDLQKSYGTTPPPNSTIVNKNYAKWQWFHDWLCTSNQKAQFNIQVPSNHPPTFFVKIDAHNP